MRPQRNSSCHSCASCSPFWPSPGEFIKWCRKGEYSTAGLPDEDELYDMVMKYRARRGLYKTPEAYPWKNSACFWMVTGLYSAMRAQGLTEQELRLKCRSELRKMATRIRSGDLVPPPRPQVEKLYVPASNERALNHVSHLKALIKSKRNSSWPK
ncbi:replication protein P [Pantoea sp. RRHST58]|uniref:replication protein P n=1 Tax=Pantoea sp. RRHST58 TaxID=3425183 RepID=UPI003D9FF5B8